LKFAVLVAFAMFVSAGGSNNSSPSPVAPTPGSTPVTTHTATSDSAGVCNIGNIGPNGGSASFTFNAAGTVHYHCSNSSG
jgi:hypothetical protein